MFYEEPCIFSGYPLDSCDELRGNDKLIAGFIHSKSARCIVFHGEVPLMDISSGLEPAYLSFNDIEKEEISEKVFLGKDDKYSYFAVQLSHKLEETSSRKYIDLRSIGRKVSIDGFTGLPSLLARGKMLLGWHGRHQFCSNCGAKSHSRKGGYNRYCEQCDSEHYPRVDPVVIMMVIYDNKCLLGRSSYFMPGNYSALAGFMEPGETIEEAVRREVSEESGIRIGKVNYIKSQPWPFPSSLMIGTICEALNDTIKIDYNELEDAKWFDKETIRQVLKDGGNDHFRVPEKIAIARHLLEYHLYEHWMKE